MGLTFSISDGALVAPRPELLDEFIGTRPPAICWRAGAALRLSDHGDGTNYQGDIMSPTSAIAISKERGRHLLARRARSRSSKDRSKLRDALARCLPRGPAPQSEGPG